MYIYLLIIHKYVYHKIIIIITTIYVLSKYIMYVKSISCCLQVVLFIQAFCTYMRSKTNSNIVTRYLQQVRAMAVYKILPSRYIREKEKSLINKFQHQQCYAVTPLRIYIECTRYCFVCSDVLRANGKAVRVLSTFPCL